MVLNIELVIYPQYLTLTGTKNIGNMVNYIERWDRRLSNPMERVFITTKARNISRISKSDKWFHEPLHLTYMGPNS